MDKDGVRLLMGTLTVTHTEVVDGADGAGGAVRNGQCGRSSKT